MVKVNIGNTVKEVGNNLYAMSQMKCVDQDHWYMEIFDALPVYRYSMDINRIDEDEDFDIYNVIFNDLVASGDFVPLSYDYGKLNYGKTKPRCEESVEELNNEKIETNRFILVSNKEPVMIYLDFEMINVVTHLGTDKIEEVVNKYLKKYDQEDDRVKCYVIVKDPDLYLDNFNVDIEGKLDFDLYNDGFEEAHKSIVNSILKDKNGLYLLYGKPGTGKSTYIRHLISECETDKRKFIYVPSKLFEDFTDPAILPFLLRNRGCVFVIEDCEDLITVDDGERSDGISDLLNVTDGILADALNIKIICTFNTDYHKIDEALLRPGRCKCKYEFELLDKDKANKVAEKLGLKKVDKDVSLAELFNPEIEYTSESKKKKKIGFNVN